MLGADHRRPPLPSFVVHVAERLSDVGIGQLRLELNQPVDRRRHVLVVGQAVEPSRERAIDGELEPPRVVEQQRVGVARFDHVAFAARLRRPEQIVEVGVVPLGPRAPVVTLVRRVEVHRSLPGSRSLGEEAVERSPDSAAPGRRSCSAAADRASSLYPWSTG